MPALRTVPPLDGGSIGSSPCSLRGILFFELLLPCSCSTVDHRPAEPPRPLPRLTHQSRPLDTAALSLAEFSLWHVPSTVFLPQAAARVPAPVFRLDGLPCLSTCQGISLRPHHRQAPRPSDPSAALRFSTSRLIHSALPASAKADVLQRPCCWPVPANPLWHHPCASSTPTRLLRAFHHHAQTPIAPASKAAKPTADPKDSSSSIVHTHPFSSGADDPSRQGYSAVCRFLPAHLSLPGTGPMMPSSAKSTRIACSVTLWKASTIGSASV